jgi:hypothetical protein
MEPAPTIGSHRKLDFRNIKLNLVGTIAWGAIHCAVPRGRRLSCKRNRYCDQYRDQTFLAESLATRSPIPVVISETVLSFENGVANEIGLIVPAAMITILCQPQ